MKKEKYRFIFQLISLIIFLFFTVLLIQNKFFISRAVCPYATVCFGITSLQTKTFLFPVAIISGLVILLATLFIGRKFCGYICPLGTVQEWLFKVKAKQRRNATIPLKLHRLLLALKYCLFIFTLATAFFGVHFLYIRFCPIYGISHPQYITLLSGLTVSGILVLGLLIERFWCRYLCPFAAFMNGFLYLGRLLHLPRPLLHRNMETCIDCTLCSIHCPMQIEIHEKEMIADVNCIYCNRCLKICPKKETLNFSKSKKK